MGPLSFRSYRGLWRQSTYILAPVLCSCVSRAITIQVPPTVAVGSSITVAWNRAGHDPTDFTLTATNLNNPDDDGPHEDVHAGQTQTGSVILGPFDEPGQYNVRVVVNGIIEGGNLISVTTSTAPPASPPPTTTPATSTTHYDPNPATSTTEDTVTQQPPGTSASIDASGSSSSTAHSEPETSAGTLKFSSDGQGSGTFDESATTDNAGDGAIQTSTSTSALPTPVVTVQNGHTTTIPPSETQGTQSTASSLSTPSDATSGPSSGKSNTKMIIGIVVGLAVPLLLLAAFFWIRRRRRERVIFETMGSGFYKDKLTRENGTETELVNPPRSMTPLPRYSPGDQTSLSHASSEDAAQFAPGFLFPSATNHRHVRSDPFADKHGVENEMSMLALAMASKTRTPRSSTSSDPSTIQPSPASRTGQARARTERQMHLYDEIMELQSKLIGLEAYGGEADAMRPDELAETKDRIAKLEVLMESDWAREVTDVRPDGL